jgi:hypothetical protein
VYLPYHACWFASATRATCVSSTDSAAIALIESKSGKRGFPGGGATAGSTVTAQPGYESAIMRE